MQIQLFKKYPGAYKRTSRQRKTTLRSTLGQTHTRLGNCAVKMLLVLQNGYQYFKPSNFNWNGIRNFWCRAHFSICFEVCLGHLFSKSLGTSLSSLSNNILEIKLELLWKIHIYVIFIQFGAWYAIYDAQTNERQHSN